MQRRSFLTLAAAGLALPTLPAFAAERVFYTPGLAEDALAAGRVVFLDLWTNWCSSCSAQDRVITNLRAQNPAYGKAITLITVDWGQYADGDLAKALQIPGRSVLVALKGKAELGQIVAGTATDEVKALMDAAFAAA